MINTILNNGGATLNKDLTQAKLAGGYMVSLKGSEEIHPSLTLKALRDYSRRVSIGFLGVWIDKGKVYLDNSINIDNLEEAIKLGKENDQLAIYDIVNDAVIEL